MTKQINIIWLRFYIFGKLRTFSFYNIVYDANWDVRSTIHKGTARLFLCYLQPIHYTRQRNIVFSLCEALLFIELEPLHYTTTELEMEFNLL